MDARSIHHDPTVHNDPGVFDPSRFPVSLKYKKNKNLILRFKDHKINCWNKHYRQSQNHTAS